MECYSAGVELSDDGDLFTITLTGDLDVTSRAPMRALIEACVETGAKRIRFVMTDVTLCGSDCAAMIVFAQRFDVSVSVLPSPCVLRTLELTGLDRYVRVEL